MADFWAGEPSMANGTHSHSSLSRESSVSSGHSRGQNKENTTRRHSNSSDMSGSVGGGGSGGGGGGCSDGLDLVMLRDGGKLTEESGTENASGLINPGYNGVQGSYANLPELFPRQGTGSGGTGTARNKVNKSGLATPIPEVEITIPKDGCLATFTVDEMAAFFKSLRLEGRLVSHLYRISVDGRKFGRLKDTDLDTLQLNNPVIVYFRDRTAPSVAKKGKQRLPFVL